MAIKNHYNSHNSFNKKAAKKSHIIPCRKKESPEVAGKEDPSPHPKTRFF
jgi:hypothetical protein